MYVLLVGELIVGTSDVRDTGWYGNVAHYKSFKDVAQSNYTSYHITESITGNGIFIDDTHVTFNKTINAIWFSNFLCSYL